MKLFQIFNKTVQQGAAGKEAQKPWRGKVFQAVPAKAGYDASATNDLRQVLNQRSPSAR